MLNSHDVLNSINELIRPEYLQGVEIKLRKNASNYDSIIVTSEKTAYRPIDTGELLFARIKLDKDSCNISVSKKYSALFSQANIDYSQSKFGDRFIQFNASVIVSTFYGNEIADIVNNIFIDLFSFPSFGCCSRYIQCSNKLRCIHPDLAYATACQYRENLENGRIFYGKNRNID